MAPSGIWTHMHRIYRRTQSHRATMTTISYYINFGSGTQRFSLTKWGNKNNFSEFPLEPTTITLTDGRSLIKLYDVSYFDYDPYLLWTKSFSCDQVHIRNTDCIREVPIFVLSNILLKVKRDVSLPTLKAPALFDPIFEVSTVNNNIKLFLI